jgi:DNA polymerase III sliding clamp (beta) subunit (PCNA family)
VEHRSDEDDVTGVEPVKFTISSENRLQFIDLVEACGELLFSATFQNVGSTLLLRSMDTANVCMVEVKLFKGMFSKFESEPEEKFAIDLRDFISQLKKLKKRDVELKFEIDRILKYTAGTVKYTVPLLAEFKQAEAHSCMENIVQIEMTAEELRQAIDDIDVGQDEVTIETVGGKLNMSVMADHGRAAEAEVCAAPTKKALASNYSFEYTKKIGEFFKSFEKVTMFLGNDYPLTMSAHTKIAAVSTLLAPRIHNE